MWNMIMQFAKTKLLSVVTKVNINDIVKQTDKVIKKMETKNETKIIQEKKKHSKEPRWQRAFPFSFFYGSGKFQPLYFFVTLFCFLAASMLFVKIYAAWVAIKKGTYNSDFISTADLATVLTFISSLVLLYNNNKKNNTNTESKDDSAN
jgi:hypothetical protein